METETRAKSIPNSLAYKTRSCQTNAKNAKFKINMLQGLEFGMHILHCSGVVS